MKLNELLSEIELHDADISGIVGIVIKSKSRIDDVLDKPHPKDNPDIISKLRDASNHLGNALQSLASVKDQVQTNNQ